MKNNIVFTSMIIATFMILLSDAAHTQVVYNQFSPDNVCYHESDVTGSMVSMIDMDQDGTNDFQITYLRHERISGPPSPWIEYLLSVTPLNENMVSYIDAQINSMAILYFQGDTISEGEYKNGQAWLRFSDNQGYAGFWNNTKNGFVGVKVVKADGEHYGWIRISNKAYGGMQRVVVHDFAYESEANTPIVVADSLGIKVDHLSATDFSNASVGLKVRVTADPVIDEWHLEEYRYMAVKYDSVLSFDIDKANAVPQGQFRIKYPNGSLVQEIFLANDMDVDGDLISVGEKYQFFVLSVDTSGLLSDNQLSVVSNTIEFDIAAEPSSNLLAEDIDDNASAADILISFNGAPAQQTILEYRAMLIPIEQISNFTVSQASALSQERYLVIEPDGSPYYETIFNENTFDVNGDIIQHDNAYYVKILSVADGVNTNINSLSNKSNLIALHEPDFLKAGETTPERVSYHDFEPDILLLPENNYTQETLYFDLLNDGVNDLMFIFFRDLGIMYTKITLDLAMINETQIIPLKLPATACISPYNMWDSNSVELSGYYKLGPDVSYSGIWLGGGPGYLGVKLLKDGETLYAWLNMSASFNSATIYDVAVFNNDILVVPESIEEENVALKITPNPFDEILKVSFKEVLDMKGEITVIGTNGKIVHSSSLQVGLQEKTINLSDQPSGIYFLIFNDGSTNHFVKVIKK